VQGWAVFDEAPGGGGAALRPGNSSTNIRDRTPAGECMTANWDPAFLGLFLVLFAAVAAFATAFRQGDRHWWFLLALLALLVTPGMLLGDGWPRRLLLDLAAFVAVAMVWNRATPEAARAGRTYLGLLCLSMVCLIGAMLVIHEAVSAPAFPWSPVAVALLVVGFGLKLALVPFYFWLPGVAASAAPMTTVLIVSVVDMAAFSELAHLRVTAPWVFGDWRPLWLAIALASMFGGALLALAQRDLKRMLAFSTIDDMGYLLLGVAVGPGIGFSGALAGALGHSLSKLLLFGAVGMAEGRLGQTLTLESRGQAARCPVSAAAFIVGALGIIGVPPTFGFVGRWRLYLAGAEFGGLTLVVTMVLATGVALLYYARAIHRVWLGAGVEATLPREPRLVTITLSIVMIAVITLGVFPGAIIRQFPWVAPR
jgi:multicomponent Na+:H+ antiporter subunit D